MKRLVLVLILALLLRVWPFSNPHLVGDADPYYHVRAAAEAFRFDELSYGGRPATYPPAFHWLLRFGHLVFGNWLLAAKTIPILLGLLTVALVFSLGKVLYSERVGLFAAAVLATYPLHVQRTAAFARPDCLLLFLMVLIPWLAYTKRYIFLPLAFATMALTSFGWPYGLVVAGLLAVSMKLEGDAWKKTAIGLCAGLLLALVYWIPFLLRNGLPPLVLRAAEQGVVKPAELVMVLTLFATVIAASNVTIRKGKYFIALWSVFGVSMLALGIRMLVYFSLPLAFSMALLYDEYLFGREACRRFVLAMVFAVFFAFAAASVLFIKDFGPEAGDGEFEAIYWIGENLRGQTMASAWELGHYLTYFGVKSLHDGYFEYAPDPLGREKAFNSLSEDVKRYGAGYLLVTREDCGRIGGDCLSLWKQDELFKNEEAVVLEVL